jgi:alkaline phosphatase
MKPWKYSLFLLIVTCCNLTAIARNVIVMIPDGTGFASLHAARDAKGEPLAIDAKIYGAVQTRSADNSVTDSAAAGTALACGLRTKNGTIGVDPAGQPLENLLEFAAAKGMATGVVTTDKIVGATPSAFSAHALSRNDADVLFEQQIASTIDVFLGGGANLLTADRKARIAAAGFSLVQTRDEMMAAQPTRLFGLFAPAEMTPMLVRKTTQTTEPLLIEMASKAIEILSKDEDGFVLMIEGALVDKGNHANDLPYATEELLAFDQTVAYVLDWAEKHGDTLVVILPDHETGGLTILNEPEEGARGKALREAMKKGLPPTSFYVHYSSTWHTAVDVFLAGNDPSVKIVRNEQLPSVVMGKHIRRLAPLMGTQVNDEQGWPCLLLEDGTRLRAYEDAIYFPATQAWYQKANK